MPQKLKNPLLVGEERLRRLGRLHDAPFGTADFWYVRTIFRRVLSGKVTLLIDFTHWSFGFDVGGQWVYLRCCGVAIPD